MPTKLILPNLDQIQKKDPKLGEALTKVQTYVNGNVTPVAGNKQAAPSFVKTTTPPG